MNLSIEKKIMDLENRLVVSKGEGERNGLARVQEGQRAWCRQQMGSQRGGCKSEDHIDSVTWDT